jgi:hypothetical protein
MFIGSDFVIATPTKTGTHTLKSYANGEDFRYVREGHRMSVPQVFARYSRHMTVRDPYQRLISIYHHMRNHRSAWGHVEASLTPFTAWVTGFLAARAEMVVPDLYTPGTPDVWLFSQYQCWRILGGEHFWRLEQLGELVDRLLDCPGAVPRLNAHSAEPYDVDEYYPSANIRERVWRQWAKKDCEAFGYPELT